VAAAATTGAVSKAAARRARKKVAQGSPPATPPAGATDGSATANARPPPPTAAAPPAPSPGTQDADSGANGDDGPRVDLYQGAVLLGLKWPPVGDLTSRYSIPKPWTLPSRPQHSRKNFSSASHLSSLPLRR
jgi:hypothetical protein